MLYNEEPRLTETELGPPVGPQLELISQKVFMKSFCRSQLPHKSVNLSFTITDTKNQLTDLYGNRRLQDDFQNTLREIKPARRQGASSTREAIRARFVLHTHVFC